MPGDEPLTVMTTSASAARRRGAVGVRLRRGVFRGDPVDPGSCRGGGRSERQSVGVSDAEHDREQLAISRAASKGRHERPFEVWRFHFEGKGASRRPDLAPDICARAKVVNRALLHQPAAKPAAPSHGSVLNGADGMDWETFCDCSTIYAVESSKLFGQRGRVTWSGGGAIRAKLRAYSC